MVDSATQRRRLITWVISTIALLATVVAATLLLTRQHGPKFRVALSADTLAEIEELESRFHECFLQWRRENGVRSPCPKLHDKTNVRMLALLGLRDAPFRKVIAVLGEPEVVFENGKYPGIFYCRFPSHWVTMSPSCGMLLPRNGNYDAMMQMSFEQNGSKLAKLPSATLK